MISQKPRSITRQTDRLRLLRYIFSKFFDALFECWVVGFTPLPNAKRARTDTLREELEYQAKVVPPLRRRLPSDGAMLQERPEICGGPTGSQNSASSRYPKLDVFYSLLLEALAYDSAAQCTSTSIYWRLGRRNGEFRTSLIAPWRSGLVHSHVHRLKTKSVIGRGTGTWGLLSWFL